LKRKLLFYNLHLIP